jgi:GNAT superfamily N-acetyltransferase
MSAEDHLQPRQFGPGGKYTTRPYGYRGIEAVHTNSGRRIGAMNWFDTPIGATGIQNKVGQTIEPDKPTIFKVVVSGNMRRKGVATAMLNHARDISPGLQHSHALSDDGAEWARARP